MSDSLVHTPQLTAAEQLLAALPGIVSARVIAGPGGAFEEIHILATAELHPKQIVRNIESALSAGLGVEINRRIVSIAQLREDAAADFLAVDETTNDRAIHVPGPETDSSAVYAAQPDALAGVAPPANAAPAMASPAHTASATASPAAPAPAPTANGAPRRTGTEGATTARVVYLGHEVTVDTDRTATCTAVFRAGEEEFAGQGTGFDSPQGRAEAAARAAVAALHGTTDRGRLGLEGVAIVDTPGHECVLVSVRTLDGRRRTSLTGAAPLRDSPEEAAILATLHATNHWRSR